MYDDFAPKMASVLTEYSVPVKPGDFVLITSNIAGEPLVTALYEAIIRRGGNPVVNVGFSHLSEIRLKLGTDEQLGFLDPSAMTQIENIDAYFSILSPINTRANSTADPAKLQKVQAAQRPLIEKYFERAGSGEINWVIAPWPTDAAAQQAEMGIHAYREFVYKACGLDQDDPVAYWQGFQEKQTKIVDWLTGKQHAHIKGPGIDLQFDFGDRTWISCHGTENFPDGEIFTSPVETSVNGTVDFSHSTYNGGREVNGVHFKFEDGCVVEASAKKGEEYLLMQLDMDEGARRLGEFAIGTNYGVTQVTGSTLFDEKIGGTIHMAIGEGFAEAGGSNKSAVHWDMVHGMQDGGEIVVDGELLYKNGEFVIDL